jgi:hypothetical protein
MKKTCLLLSSLSLALFAILVTGCGSGNSVAPVTGTVTLDGQPVADIELIFEPQQVDGGSANVGPYSMGTTDSSGKFTLETRNGEAGAIVAKHQVTFNFAGEDPEEAIAEAQGMMQEADGDQAIISKAKATIERLKNAPKMPERYSGMNSEITADVKAGENTFTFELTTDKSGE